MAIIEQKQWLGVPIPFTKRTLQVGEVIVLESRSRETEFGSKLPEGKDIKVLSPDALKVGTLVEGLETKFVLQGTEEINSPTVSLVKRVNRLGVEKKYSYATGSRP